MKVMNQAMALIMWEPQFGTPRMQDEETRPPGCKGKSYHMDKASKSLMRVMLKQAGT